MNLEERLRHALVSLEGIRDEPSEYRNKDRERINGKIEGVKLALSYLEDEKKFENENTTHD